MSVFHAAICRRTQPTATVARQLEALIIQIPPTRPAPLTHASIINVSHASWLSHRSYRPIIHSPMEGKTKYDGGIKAITPTTTSTKPLIFRNTFMMLSLEWIASLGSDRLSEMSPSRSDMPAATAGVMRRFESARAKLHHVKPRGIGVAFETSNRL
jgi:hypothetical protein